MGRCFSRPKDPTRLNSEKRRRSESSSGAGGSSSQDMPMSERYIGNGPGNGSQSQKYIPSPQMSMAQGIAIANYYGGQGGGAPLGRNFRLHEAQPPPYNHMASGGGRHYHMHMSPSAYTAEPHQSSAHGHMPPQYQQQRPLNGSGSGDRGSRSPARVLAIYDYNNLVNGDVSFSKGDIMELLDDSNYDWWYVRHPKNDVGYAPRNFLARIESLESEEWFAGKIQRSLAEKLVLAGNLPRGTFLIRKRETGGEYALTINDSKNDLCEVKHYKIRPMDNGSGFYITTRKIFPTIRDLVAYYTKESGGLCCRLTFPAPRLAPVRPDLSYDTAKNWEIAREELDMARKLGDGNFGEVWLARWRNSVEVAVKMMKPGTMSVMAFLREAQIMKSLNHPKLVKLYAVCTVGEPYYIVTEYMINGSLLHYLRGHDARLPMHALVDMCGQIASGMMYLESRKLVHRDLAARNVLVGDKISGVPEVKVADFGLARKLLEENIYEAQTGAKFPIKWTAPEAAQYGNFTVKSDVWSYGILVYEIFTFGHTPYPGMQNREVIEQLALGYRMPKPVNCPEPIYQEVLKCWDDDSNRRPTFEYLFGFFDDYFVSCQPNYVPPSVDGIAASMELDRSHR